MVKVDTLLSASLVVVLAYTVQCMPFNYETPRNTDADTNTYRGQFTGTCQGDGIYYNDEDSFVLCSGGAFYKQLCAPGSKNLPFDGFTELDWNDFCGVIVERKAPVHKPAPHKPHPHPAPELHAPEKYPSAQHQPHAMFSTPNPHARFPLMSHRPDMFAFTRRYPFPTPMSHHNNIFSMHNRRRYGPIEGREGNTVDSEFEPFNSFPRENAVVDEQPPKEPYEKIDGVEYDSIKKEEPAPKEPYEKIDGVAYDSIMKENAAMMEEVHEPVVEEAEMMPEMVDTPYSRRPNPHRHRGSFFHHQRPFHARRRSHGFYRPSFRPHPMVHNVDTQYSNAYQVDTQYGLHETQQRSYMPAPADRYAPAPEPKYNSKPEEPKMEKAAPKKDAYATDDSYYHGQFSGKCSGSGIYYRDEKSFVLCVGQHARVQDCPPGTKNLPFSKFSNDFCSVNLVDQQMITHDSPPSDHSSYTGNRERNYYMHQYHH